MLHAVCLELFLKEDAIFMEQNHCSLPINGDFVDAAKCF